MPVLNDRIGKGIGCKDKCFFMNCKKKHIFFEKNIAIGNEIKMSRASSYGMATTTVSAKVILFFIIAKKNAFFLKNKFCEIEKLFYFCTQYHKRLFVEYDIEKCAEGTKTYWIAFCYVLALKLQHFQSMSGINGGRSQYCGLIYLDIR